MSTYKLMKAERLPNSLSDYLENLDLNSLENLLGGFTSDSKLCWMASDSYLEVVRVKSAQTVSRWNFGSVLKVTTSKIVSVDELKSSFNEVLMLVVGLEFLGTTGMVCIFDIYSMKIVRAIQIPERVTFVHVIYNGNETTTFPGVLNSFDGALAVGTANGNVYIVDLCREAVNEARQITLTPKIKDELDPCNLIILRPEDLHCIESHKEVADRKGNHLAIHLNVLIGEQSPHFILKGPQGDTRVFVNKEEVFVSSLHFAPQLSSLLVGYNFGALQIWDLISTDLVYTSPVCEETVPISHFAIQEPVDDPRAFCYFWAVYSYTEPHNDSFPIAALYSLCYESKEWHEGYGYIYQNLQSCNIRFQTDLAVPNKVDVKGAAGAQCLRLHSFSNIRNRDLGSSSITEPYDDSYKLCLMAWNVWYKDRSSKIFLSIFDLNQWYKEQMPNVPHEEQSKKYMTTVCISDVSYQHCEHKFPAIDVHINPTTISLFKGAQKLEEHYYPTSLAFECSMLTEYEICYMKNFGVQRKFYRNLGEDGPLALLKPSGLYEKSVEIGLTPLFMEPMQLNHTNATHQREHILSIALENKMRNWLYKCAASWGNGSHRIAGLSLDLMLNWAWERAKVLKTNADIVCTTLFDYSAIKLDQNARSILNKCRGQILVIKDLYKYILTNCKQYLINPDLTSKQYKCLERIYAYLDVLGWMYNVGLLPEHHSTHVDHEGTLVPYSLAALRKVYEERRAELRLLDKKKLLFDGETVLFIDKFIEMCGSSALEEEWSRTGGGSRYPPSSLQALLRTYLVEDLELQMKHIIVSYLFMDIADSLDPVEHKLTIANLLKFPVIFQFNRSQLKLIQGFWHLDHNQLGSAGELFIDPMLESKDLESWHHKQILSTFMLQDANKLALLYLTFKRPPINDINDESTVIAVYVNNKMLQEAFTLQRQRSRREDTTLLNVIFRELLRTDQLKDLIPMTLTRKEEEELIDFLDRLRYHDRNDFKAVYFAIRGRYFDFRLHVKPEKRPDGDFCLSNTCRDILDTMVTSDDKKIVELCLAERGNLLKSCETPKPMSTFFNNKKENIKYKSNFIYACVAKSHEIWRDAAERESYFQNKNAKIRGDDFPFLRSLNAAPFKHSYNSELIYPKIVTTLMESPEEEEEDGPSPVKRMKLSPRQAVHTPQTPKYDPAIKKLLTNFDTPVITASRMQTSAVNEATPQSILKEHSVHSRVAQLSTPKYVETNDDHSVSSIGKRIILTPSKRRSVVRFTDSASAYSSAATKNFLEDVQMDVSPLPDITNTRTSCKSNVVVDDESTTESFYSPEVSSNNADDKMEEESREKRTVIEKDDEMEESEDVKSSTKHLSITDTSFTKKTSSTSVRESNVVKKTSMCVEERSFVKKTASVIEERSFVKTRSASPFKASRMLEDFGGSGESAVQSTKDVRESVSETSVVKPNVQERSSWRELSSSLGGRRFDSPVPATLRSRKSYKGDFVKRVTRSSLFTQDEEDVSKDSEEMERPKEDNRKKGPSVSREVKRSKSPALERNSSQKGRRSMLLNSSENDHAQIPLSRKSYRGGNISVQAKLATRQEIEENPESEDELMEVISISSRTTADIGLDEASSASNENQNQGDAISVDEDSNDDDRLVNEDVMFAAAPEYSEEESIGGTKRRIAGKIVFDPQEEDGEDYSQSRLAVTLDNDSIKSRLEFDIEDDELEGNNANVEFKSGFEEEERKSKLGFGDKAKADSDDSASLHGFDSGDFGPGDNLSQGGRNESKIVTGRRSQGQLMISGRRSLATVSKRRSQTAADSSAIVSQRSSKSAFLKRPPSEERTINIADSSTVFGRRQPSEDRKMVSDRRSQTVCGRREETAADSSTGGHEFVPQNFDKQLIPSRISSTNEPTVSDSSPVFLNQSPPYVFARRSVTAAKRSIIAQLCTSVDSDDSDDREEQLETISLSSKSDSGHKKMETKGRSNSEERTSLRSCIFKLACRKSLRSSNSSPNISIDVASRQKRFTIDESHSSDSFEKNITEGDITSLVEDLKDAETTGSYEISPASSANVFEKNVSDLETFSEKASEEGDNETATKSQNLDAAVQTTLIYELDHSNEEIVEVKEISETREEAIDDHGDVFEKETASNKMEVDEEHGDVNRKDQRSSEKASEGGGNKTPTKSPYLDAGVQTTLICELDHSPEEIVEVKEISETREEAIDDHGDVFEKETASNRMEVDEEQGDVNRKDQRSSEKASEGGDNKTATKSPYLDAGVQTTLVYELDHSTEEIVETKEISETHEEAIDDHGDEFEKQTVDEEHGDVNRQDQRKEQDNKDPSDTKETEHLENREVQVVLKRKETSEADREETTVKNRADLNPEKTSEENLIQTGIQRETAEGLADVSKKETSEGQRCAADREQAVELESRSLDAESAKREEIHVSEDREEIDSKIPQVRKTDDNTTAVTPRKLRKRDDTPLLDSPARRTRSVTSSGSSPLPTRTLRTRRAVSTDFPPELPKTPTRKRNLSIKESEVEKSASPAARNRRASTSTEPGVAMAPATRRTTRAKSVDAVLEVPQKATTSRGKGRKSALPAISEVIPVLENRRLTRRQKELFMKNLKCDDEKYDINLQAMDPMQLLDKEEFKGNADPDEQQLLQHSPAPSVISSSATDPTDRKERGHSSDRSTSEIVTGKRNLRSSSKAKDEPMKHALSHISEGSEEEAPPKAKAKRYRPRKI